VYIKSQAWKIDSREEMLLSKNIDSIWKLLILYWNFILKMGKNGKDFESFLNLKEAYPKHSNSLSNRNNWEKESTCFKILYCLRIYYILANRGLALHGTNFFCWQKSICIFYMTQSFFSLDLLRFWSLRYPRVRRLGLAGHTCVKNRPWVGVEVCAKFGGYWSGICAWMRYIGTSSLFYIHM